MLQVKGSSLHTRGPARSSKPKQSPKTQTSLPPIKAATATGSAIVKKKPPSSTLSKQSQQPISAPVRSLVEEALFQLCQPTRSHDGSCGMVKIRYNHYQKLFPIFNGVLKWEDVNEEYSFSFVFKGQYRRDLVFVTSNPSNPRLFHFRLADDGSKTLAVRDAAGEYFLSLHDQDELVADLQEDAAHGVGVDGLIMQTQPLNATQLGVLSFSPTKEDRHGLPVGVHLLTEELKAMRPADLQGATARDLRERRDIEDILYATA